MKNVNLIYTTGKVKSHNLTVSINFNNELVFNEGDYYPPIKDGDSYDGGREYDEYLIVDPKHKAVVFQCLLADLPRGSQVPQVSDSDEQLLQTIQYIAPLKKWQSLAEIEKWLVDKQIPFKKDHWLQID